MQVEIKDGYLVIKLPVQAQPSLSATGKSLVVASTRGNQPTSAQVQGKPLVVSVNAYISAR